MKKLQILAISLLSTLMVFAQPEKGNIFLGGNVNFDIGSSKNTTGGTETKGPKTLSFGITPKVGYFFTDKLAAGIDLGFAMNNSKLDNSGTTTTRNSMSFGGGLFARYYVMPVERFGFFFEAGANAMLGSSKVKVGNNETKGPKSFQLNAGITPGIAVYISKKIALEASYGFLGYSSYSDKKTVAGQEIKNNEGNFSLNLNPNTFKFGVSVLF